MKKICDAILKYKIDVVMEANNDIQKDSSILIEELKNYRKKISALEGIHAYIIYKDETII